MPDFYESPKLNLTSANEHIPKIKRQIRVIKERTRAVVYSMQFNSIPSIMLIHVVLFVVKQLNLFTKKRSISTFYSPRQIMSGQVVEYKQCAMGCGNYCQISDESEPRNSVAPKTQVAISLGPSGNVQGEHKFYTILTGKIVVRCCL
jgi:hypothetical protein